MSCDEHMAGQELGEKPLESIRQMNTGSGDGSVLAVIAARKHFGDSAGSGGCLMVRARARSVPVRIAGS